MGMLCTEFLDLYSEYRDGLITDPDTVDRIHQHLTHCFRCMGYDALVSRGVIALRTMADLEPSIQLKRRLRAATSTAYPFQEAGAPVRSAPASIMASLTVACTLLVVAWIAIALSDRSTTPPAIAAAPAAPEPALEPAPPVTEIDDLSLLVFKSQTPPPAAPPQMSFGTWVTLSR